ncbi:metal ABC transporter solute-binding protein, Zn/Mn family [Asaia krungthepensis]|uniref:ABC transporter substrate-binding periplasmic protein n=1 Tax=Asaia krungthepensis NRIC 0535 TaxID=1307925 RepID=A0ABQ0Q3C3_9PROT|nr:zinc ABC transporter substrate-binding protein [Asaia krungthepensis]GBQ89349.1 ABC transporter substrate-binding periplasmic protein [Asaia krungthepensis NRIC 0535]
MRQFLPILICFLTLLGSAKAAPVRVFCAEALWCDLASGLGGQSVHTASVLTSPRIDPHDFQVSPDMARELAESSIVVLTGGHYDDWIDPLLSAQPSPSRRVISAAALSGLPQGANPHLFDDPAAIDRVIAALGDALAHSLPDQAAAIREQQAHYRAMTARFSARMAALRPVTKGMKIAVLEPVGGPVFDALGLDVVDPDFALAMMNHVDPAPRDVAFLEEAIQHRTIKALVINPAMSGPMPERLQTLARHAGIAVVAFDEFPAPSVLWQDWMTSRLDRLVAALGVRG